MRNSLQDFQWQRKTTGKADTGDRPLLPKDRSIFEQDAVLAYDERVPRRDAETGEILTIWNGHSTKPHPITGREVPDESARTVLFDYINPRRAEWPKADYIVGNPPFIGASRMREALGDGYAEALRKAWKGDVPESSDFVMFWWRKAAELVRDGKAKRFGFITTNSIHQTFNRRVIEPFLEGRDRPPGGPANGKRMSQPKNSPKSPSLDHSSTSHSHGPPGGRSLPMHLAYAIPDHPWIDSADGAAVRIAMTVTAPGHAEGILEKVTAEQAHEDGENEVSLVKVGGVIAPNLQIGADLTSAIELRSNSEICWEGMKPHGKGFLIDSALAVKLGFWSEGSPILPVRRYFNGRDITDSPRDLYAIDLFGHSLIDAQSQFPSLLNHLMTAVKPERDQNNRETYRLNWWFFGEPRRKNRPSLKGLSRFIVTVKTAKHRTFVFLDNSCLPDSKLIAIASDDAFVFAALSSAIHGLWTFRIGSHLGVGNDPTYVVGSSFNKFPFPALEEGPLKQRIRDLGERLDAHRKRQQEQHPDLTLTGIYNVLQKIRSGEALNAKDKTIHDQGLVTLLKQLHDDLDAAVLEACGWGDLAVETQDFKTQDFKTQDTRPRSSAPSMLPSPSSLASCVLPSCVSPADLIARGGPDAEALEQAILTRLVALNHERAAEEKRGLIRWLRPDYQAPGSCDGHRPTLQTEIGLPDDDSSTEIPSHRATETPAPWPADLPAQVAAVRKLLPTAGQDPETLAACFGRKNKRRTDQITAILATLKALGHVG